MTRNFAAWPIILLLTVLSLPLFIMYLFLLVDTFSNTAPGSLLPNEFTLEHWRFLIDPTITGDVWKPTLTTVIFSASLMIIVVSVSATAGYALSRLALPFRRFVLSGIMVMHAFPSVTLIIGVFLVLQFAGLYNSLTGVILVKASLMLPFGDRDGRCAGWRKPLHRLAAHHPTAGKARPSVARPLRLHRWLERIHAAADSCAIQRFRSPLHVSQHGV
jgi:ABC-type spermidine/putrescine transport system permease subunit II